MQIAALLLCGATLVAGHGGEHMDMSATHNESEPSLPPEQHDHNLGSEPSYVGLEAHSGWMLAHIGFMVLAWFFVLPIGKSRIQDSKVSDG